MDTHSLKTLKARSVINSPIRRGKIIRRENPLYPGSLPNGPQQSELGQMETES